MMALRNAIILRYSIVLSIHDRGSVLLCLIQQAFHVNITQVPPREERGYAQLQVNGQSKRAIQRL